MFCPFAHAGVMGAIGPIHAIARVAGKRRAVAMQRGGAGRSGSAPCEVYQAEVENVAGFPEASVS